MILFFSSFSATLFLMSLYIGAVGETLNAIYILALALFFAVLAGVISLHDKLSAIHRALDCKQSSSPRYTNYSRASVRFRMRE